MVTYGNDRIYIYVLTFRYLAKLSSTKMVISIYFLRDIEWIWKILNPDSNVISNHILSLLLEV